MNHYNYWHQGLELLLQGQEEEAQMVWLSAISEGTPEQIEIWLAELVNVLNAEALNQEAIGNYDKAWLLRQHIRENAPEDLDNLLKLVLASMKLKIFVPSEDLNLQKILELLILEPLPNCDSGLLLSVLRQLMINFAFEDIYGREFAKACIHYYQLCLHSHPNSSEPHYRLGNIYAEIGQTGSAISCYNQALALDPNYAESFFSLGNIDMNAGRDEAAIANYQRAIQLKPDFAKPYVNLACIQEKQLNLTDAISNLQTAIQLQPNFAEAYGNLGQPLLVQGDVAGAIAAYQKAVELNRDLANAHYNLGLALLMTGNFLQGYAEYEWRWSPELKKVKHRSFPQALWDGSSLTGKTMLVWGEQGVGDEIIYASTIPELATMTKSLMLECDPRLTPLFARSFPQVEVVSRETQPQSQTLDSNIHVQSPMGSLAQFLRQNFESFPSHNGYLKADPILTEKYRQKYAALDHNLKVGISWQSSTKTRFLAPLTAWQPILNQAGVTFVNLQYGDCDADLLQVREHLGVDIYNDDTVDSMQNLENFAAQVSALDLVITISNTTAHIAGALGKPVWVLLKLPPDIWYWFLERSDSPWYPNTKLFRQNQPGVWQEVFDRVAKELQSLVKAARNQKS